MSSLNQIFFNNIKASGKSNSYLDKLQTNSFYSQESRNKSIGKIIDNKNHLAGLILDPRILLELKGDSAISESLGVAKIKSYDVNSNSVVIEKNTLLKINVEDGGFGYVIPPKIIIDKSEAGLTAKAEAILVNFRGDKSKPLSITLDENIINLNYGISSFRGDKNISSVEIVDVGGGFRTVPNITLDEGPSQTALVEPRVNDQGIITYLRLINPGAGYCKKPNLFLPDYSQSTTRLAEKYFTLNTNRNKGVIGKIENWNDFQEVLFEYDIEVELKGSILNLTLEAPQKLKLTYPSNVVKYFTPLVDSQNYIERFVCDSDPQLVIRRNALDNTWCIFNEEDSQLVLIHGLEDSEGGPFDSQDSQLVQVFGVEDSENGPFDSQDSQYTIIHGLLDSQGNPFDSQDSQYTIIHGLLDSEGRLSNRLNPDIPYTLVHGLQDSEGRLSNRLDSQDSQYIDYKTPLFTSNTTRLADLYSGITFTCSSETVVSTGISVYGSPKKPTSEITDEYIDSQVLTSEDLYLISSKYVTDDSQSADYFNKKITVKMYKKDAYNIEEDSQVPFGIDVPFRLLDSDSISYEDLQIADYSNCFAGFFINDSHKFEVIGREVFGKLNVKVVRNKNNTENVYEIDGIKQQTISLERNRTYIFNFDNSVIPYPFRIQKSLNTNDNYLNGITSGTNYLKFEVSEETPETLYYNCSSQDGMGGTIKIYTNVIPVETTKGNNVTINISDLTK